MVVAWVAVAAGKKLPAPLLFKASYGRKAALKSSKGCGRFCFQLLIPDTETGVQTLVSEMVLCPIMRPTLSITFSIVNLTFTD
jgi:hypothetical protein